MKKFAVLKVMRICSDIVREFDDEKDAHQFAELLRKSEDSPNISYATVKNLDYTVEHAQSPSAV